MYCSSPSLQACYSAPVSLSPVKVQVEHMSDSPEGHA